VALPQRFVGSVEEGVFLEPPATKQGRAGGEDGSTRPVGRVEP
jgi:hypothetical protein